MAAKRFSMWGWLVGILILATWLRVDRVGERGLWFDEGVSLTYSQIPPAEAVRYYVLWEDTNPPAYRTLLGVWTLGAGTTPLAARLFSGLLGIIAAALTYRIGRSMRLGRRAALLGALLVAVMPMQVYYSREVKHYTFVQVFLLLATWLWLIRFRRSARFGWARLGALAGCVALAVGAHYMSLLMIAALDLWTLTWLIRARRDGVPWREAAPPVIGWIAAQGAAALIWLPWVLATFNGAAAGARSASANVGLEPSGPVAYLMDHWMEYAGGPVDRSGERLALAVFAVLAAGWTLFAFSRSRATLIRLAIWLLAPVLLGFGVQQIVPFFYPRFLMVVTPALALLMGAGVGGVWEQVVQDRRLAAGSPRRRALGLSTVILLGSLCYAIPAFRLIQGQVALPEPSPDLRPVAAGMAGRLEKDDALIYSYSWQPGMMTSYLPPGREPAAIASFFGSTPVESAVGEILERHGRVWLLTYQIGAENPINDVGLALLDQAATPGSVWYGESQLTLFVAPSRIDNPGPAATCAALGGGRLRVCYAPVQAQRSSSDRSPLALALAWEALEALPERYVVFVHLLAPDNPIPVAQQDSQPRNGRRPTYEWLPGERVIDLRAVDLPPAAGRRMVYRILIGLYDADTLERVAVDGGGDSIEIGTLTDAP